jgi:hypothetical protein
MDDGNSATQDSAAELLHLGGNLNDGFGVTAPGLNDAAYAAGGSAAQGAIDRLSPALPWVVLGAGLLLVLLAAR